MMLMIYENFRNFLFEKISLQPTWKFAELVCQYNAFTFIRENFHKSGNLLSFLPEFVCEKTFSVISGLSSQNISNKHFEYNLHYLPNEYFAIH